VAVDPKVAAAWAAALRDASTTTVPITPSGGAVQVEGTKRVRAATRRAAAGPRGGSDGSAASLLILGGILAAMVAGGLVLRRTRRRPVP
jgi:LPXTG-motif cell wall-anchored protein